MAKLLVRAGFCMHAGLALAVAMLPLCLPLTAQSPGTASFFLSGAGGRKKSASAPGPPPVRATLPPAFTIPIDPLGFSPPGTFYLGLRYSLASLDFLDDDHLLFTFRVPGLIHRDLSHRETNGNDPNEERKVRAVVLKLPEGTVQAEAVWSLHDRKRYLWMLDNGQFLLRDRDNLQLGDATLQLKPYLRFPGPVLWVEMDPARKFVIAGSSEPPTSASKAGEVAGPTSAAATIVSDDPRPGAEPDLILRILRRDSGKVMLVTHVRSAVHLPINSDGYLETLRGNGKAWAVNLNYFSGGSTTVGTIDSVCSPMLDFVSPRQFLATTCDPDGNPRVVAMSTGGRHLWEYPGSGSSVWPVLITSRSGSRLARETLTTGHSVNSFSPISTEDVKGQDVQVFDAATGKVVLRAQANPIFDVGGNVAISPSGLRAAILMSEGIQVFDLPVPPPLPDDPQKPLKP
ncbi:MAG TPA: hypothetical protein VFD98_13970 [Terracidiphilus sp.]|nr:hypothetical protein [Terracidiphilus sp.]